VCFCSANAATRVGDTMKNWNWGLDMRIPFTAPQQVSKKIAQLICEFREV
jgi:hypothetical protein